MMVCSLEVSEVHCVHVNKLHTDTCQQKGRGARVSAQQILCQLAEIYLKVPGAAKKAAGNVTSCSSALWEVEFAVGLWCSSDQSPPVILSNVSRCWRQMDTCSLLSSVCEGDNKVIPSRWWNICRFWHVC